MNLDDMVAGATAEVMEVDFSAALDFDSFTGEFPMVVLAVEPGVTGPNSKVPGTPKIVLKCEVLSGADDKGTDRTGRKVQTGLNLAGEGAGITRSALAVLGQDADDVATNGLRLSTLVGQRFIGVTKPSSWNEDFTDIKKFKPYVEGEDFSL